MDKRPTLLNVALRTGFGGRFDQARWIQCAVGIMAIGAFHQSFGHSMMNGLSELALYRQMTRVAQLRLSTLHQTVLEPPKVFGSLRHLEEVRLRKLHVTAALIFDLVDEMACVTITA